MHIHQIKIVKSKQDCRFHNGLSTSKREARFVSVQKANIDLQFACHVIHMGLESESSV